MAKRTRSWDNGIDICRNWKLQRPGAWTWAPEQRSFATTFPAYRFAESSSIFSHLITYYPSPSCRLFFNSFPHLHGGDGIDRRVLDPVVFRFLSRGGVQVCLVNAHHVRHVFPAQSTFWIGHMAQYLHSALLLESLFFVPKQESAPYVLAAVIAKVWSMACVARSAYA